MEKSVALALCGKGTKAAPLTPSVFPCSGCVYNSSVNSIILIVSGEGYTYIFIKFVGSFVVLEKVFRVWCETLET